MLYEPDGATGVTPPECGPDDLFVGSLVFRNMDNTYYLSHVKNVS
jgi:hypothetical protein